MLDIEPERERCGGGNFSPRKPQGSARCQPHYGPHHRWDNGESSDLAHSFNVSVGL